MIKKISLRMPESSYIRIEDLMPRVGARNQADVISFALRLLEWWEKIEREGGHHMVKEGTDDPYIVEIEFREGLDMS